MDSPLVSVIMPTYNQQENVEETLRSILVQTYANIEVLVSDDCSLDKTATVLEKIAKEDERIKLFLQGENLGITRNYNFLADKAKGKYVAWFSGDDIMHEEKIHRQVAMLEARPEASFCHHAVTVIDAVTGKELYTMRNHREDRVTTASDILRDLGISGSMSVMCRRSLLRSPAFEPSISVASDWLQLIDIAEQGGGVYIQDSLCCYRKDQGYNGKDPTKYEGDFLRTLEIIETRYAKKNVKLMGALEDAKNRYFLGSAFRQIMAGRRGEARKSLALRTHGAKGGLVALGLLVLTFVRLPLSTLNRVKQFYHKVSR